MGRPLSWLNRLVHIARAVDDSARSHYDRKDIQQLFELQPRSAQNLMTAMPIVEIGNVHLVEREALYTFLQRLVESDNPSEAFASLRTREAKPVRRKLKTLSLQQVSADLNNPPSRLTLRRGEMTVRFQTAEELAEAMVYLATILQHDLKAFATRYEPLTQAKDTEEQKEEERRKADVASLQNWCPQNLPTV